MITLRRLLLRDHVVALALGLSVVVGTAWFGMNQIAWRQAESRVSSDLRHADQELAQRFGEVERLAASMGTLWQEGQLDVTKGEACWRILHPLVLPHRRLTRLNLIRADGYAFGLGRVQEDWGGRTVFPKDGQWVSGPILGDPKNIVRADPVQSRRAMDYRTRPYYQAGMKAAEGFWTEPYPFLGYWAGHPGISYVLPLRDAQGSLQACLSLDLLLESVTQSVREVRPTPGASLMIIDGAGRVITPPLKGKSEPEEAARKTFLRSVGPNDFPLAYQLLEASRNGRASSVEVRLNEIHYYGRLVPFTRLKGHTWYIVLALPVQDVHGDPRRKGMILGGMALALLLLLAWQLHHFAHRLAMPLDALVDAAESLGRHETPKLPSTPIRELRSLGIALEEAHQALHDREALQDQLRQAQKLETVGTLAGGIAHDVNNQLTAILGQLEMGLEHLPETHPARRHMSRASQAALRCAETTRALLAFSRPSQPELAPLDLNTVVRESLLLLGRAVKSQVRLVADMAEDLPAVMGDQVQLEQMLVNLVVNARDAMPAGGTILVSTALAPSGEVLLQVQDNGVGMSPEVQARIFEPFYTTKGPGQGTGLGLSMVLGLVKAHLGRIEVDSRWGEGSTFRIFLKGIDKPSGDPSLPQAQEEQVRLDGKRILIAEDEPAILATLSEALATRGAEVVEARDGEEAWARYQVGAFDLVLSDHFMPRCTGLELLERIRLRAPHQAVVLASGRGLETLDSGTSQDPYLRLLSKPFSIHRLVNVMLDLIGR